MMYLTAPTYCLKTISRPHNTPRGKLNKTQQISPVEKIQLRIQEDKLARVCRIYSKKGIFGWTEKSHMKRKVLKKKKKKIKEKESERDCCLEREC